jgi:hypothetical protein
MEDADTDNGTAGALDFSEFMTCIDGDSIALKDFLTKLQTRADLEDYEDCLASYQTQRKVVQQEKRVVDNLTTIVWLLKHLPLPQDQCVLPLETS